MKMVAASRFRMAQVQAEDARPYAVAMAEMLARVVDNIIVDNSSHKLLAGTGVDQKHLLVVVTADRGLCGGFNSNLVRSVRKKALELVGQKKDVSLICVGRKGKESLNRDFSSYILESFTGLFGSKYVEYVEAEKITQFILEKFDEGVFDVCTLIYNEFRSVLTQEPIFQQLIPFKLFEDEDADVNADEDVDTGEKTQEAQDKNETDESEHFVSFYDFEPGEEEIIDILLPRNLSVQIFRAFLDSAAGEHAARMTAMDSATRNAGDMIDDLSLQYNRARQAHITRELIEIISGAEAM